MWVNVYLVLLGIRLFSVAICQPAPVAIMVLSSHTGESSHTVKIDRIYQWSLHASGMPRSLQSELRVYFSNSRQEAKNIFIEFINYLLQALYRLLAIKLGS
eukprot:TRINITY_DN2029_c1_g1_i1.p1 TRINITY_DN2029_c1_g1~~TRINITY_DN2029_c1_g1_i1.p1  ORF type:complete len:101 (+),score=6.48 TRINITY_DN2029_c1_g1_i1:171-473(+)